MPLNSPPFAERRRSSGRAGVIHPNFRRSGDLVRTSDRLPEARLAEAVALARAIGLDVPLQRGLNLHEPRPATLLGSGTVTALGAEIAYHQIDVVVVDAPVTPVQQRNLEKAWNCKVIDRTGLILEIFGARARTSEGRLQVELASLSYQRSRLVRSWTHLERQRGGFGFLGGPGERQIESDRRLISERIARLKRELGTVRRTRVLHRASRRRVPYAIVALVGYTNAGKSTLFNRLTEAQVAAVDMLFATLDPTMRALSLPGGQHAILSDTVGFVSDLPTDLVAAFAATLEEVVEADVIVHVRDVAHPDSEAQRQDVLGILHDLGISPEVPMIEVMNKIDQVDAERRVVLINQCKRNDLCVAVSALSGEGCPELTALLARIVTHRREAHRFRIELSDGASIAWLYAHGTVVDRRDDERFAHVVARLSQPDANRFRQRMAQTLPTAAD
ncbi:MAG: GTPase HflX [Alphaproteobacteria bacterium]|nr:GTPase HflX [Alphaproteobacteria bacterium]